MSLLDEAVREKLFDVRMVERNVDRKVVSRKDWEKAAAALPDDSENADWVNLEELEKTEFAPSVGGYTYTEPERRKPTPDEF